ncbi:glycoside hydrolase family 6 protein [Streptomyces sp. NPDC054838]
MAIRPRNRLDRGTLVSLGFDANPGMLTGTSRTGWGRRGRAPTWCNQAGAGLGERPRAAPAAGVDACVCLWFPASARSP